MVAIDPICVLTTDGRILSLRWRPRSGGLGRLLRFAWPSPRVGRFEHVLPAIAGV